MFSFDLSTIWQVFFSRLLLFYWLKKKREKLRRLFAFVIYRFFDFCWHLVFLPLVLCFFDSEWQPFHHPTSLLSSLHTHCKNYQSNDLLIIYIDTNWKFLSYCISSSDSWLLHCAVCLPACLPAMFRCYSLYALSTLSYTYSTQQGFCT